MSKLGVLWTLRHNAAPHQHRRQQSLTHKVTSYIVRNNNNNNTSGNSAGKTPTSFLVVTAAVGGGGVGDVPVEEKSSIKNDMHLQHYLKL